MTLSDAAREARVSRQTIMELIDKGRIGWRDDDGTRHIDEAKFRIWLTADARLRYRGLLPARLLKRGYHLHRQRAHKVVTPSKFIQESERIREVGPYRRGRRNQGGKRYLPRLKKELPKRKTCPYCREEKAAKGFYTTKSKAQGWRLSGWCKSCTKKNTREFYSKKKEKHHEIPYNK